MSDTSVEGAAVDEVDDLAAAYAEIAPKPYRFVWPDQSQQWVLPHLGALDYRLQEEIEGYQSLDSKQVHDLFNRMFGPEQAERWAQVEVPTPALFMLFERWLKHSGAKPGEDEASPPSSKSTGRRSRPTSAATTTSGSPKRSTAKRAARTAASPPGNSST